jgi:lipooligosaccharide transport system permease protein
MFYAMALCMTGLSKSYEFFNYYFTLWVAPMYLFSGVFFPLEKAPDWARSLAHVLPLTHVVAISRALVRGTPSIDLVGNVLALAAYLALAVALAGFLLSRRLRV